MTGDVSISDPEADGLRTSVRALWTIVKLTFRASPPMAAAMFLLEPIAVVNSLAIPLFLKLFTNAVVAGSSAAVVTMGVAIGVAFAASLTLSTLGFNVRITMMERVSHHVDLRTSELTAGIPGLEHLERPEYLDRIEMLRRDPQGVGNTVNALVFNLVGVTRFVAAVVLLASADPLLAVFPVVGVVPLAVSRRSQKRQQALEDERSTIWRRARHLVELGTQPASGKELRLFSLRQPLLDQLRHQHRSEDRLDRRVTRQDAVEAAVGDVVFSGAHVAAVVYVTLRALAGAATVGDVILVMALAGQVSGALAQLVGNYAWLSGNLRNARRFLWLLDYAAARRRDDARPAPRGLADGIRLRGVCFTYPGTDVEVLHDVDLTLPAGSVAAIVGENGAGKTTLVHLLCQFYQATSGTIEVDGTDLVSIDPVGWRARVAATFQDFANLEFPAATAIGLGDVPRRDDLDAVGTATDRAGARVVIKSLPDGFATHLGKQWADGVELSGGQWQRVALARGLMRDDPLLVVLDEPTSALDAAAEHALFERFAAAARSRAERGAVTVIVSHRFSTVRVADLIVVLENGRVTEQGRHEELMRRGGTYAELFELQARGYR
ncbi:MAG TPA: ABC transporter ATP-binding protein [Nitriliruptorales bacterium]